MSDDTTLQDDGPPSNAAPDPATVTAGDTGTSDAVPAATPEQDSWLHQTLGVDVSSYVSEATAAVSNAASTATGGASAIATEVDNAATDVSTTLSDAASDIGYTVSQAAGDVGTTVTDAASTVADDTWAAAGDTGGALASAGSVVAGDVAQAADGVGSTLVAAGSAIAGDVSATASAVTGKLADGHFDIGGDLGSAASAIGGTLADAGGTIAGDVGAAASDAFGAVSDAAQTVASDIGQAAGDVAGTLGDAGSTIAGEVSDAATTVAGEVSDAATGFVGDVASAAQDIGSTVSDAVSTIGSDLTDADTAVESGVSSMWSGIKDGVSSAYDAASNTVSRIIDGPPVPRTELGPAQSERATKLLQGMPPEDQAKVQALLDKATPTEKAYLQKAIASKHSADEIEMFYNTIAGKDQSWMDKNLHVVGDTNNQPGIKQQWHDSCGPTTIQAMKAELDPIYALQLRTQNKDVTQADDSNATAVNPNLAAEQQSILEANQGTAVNRDDRSGAGMVLEGALNDQSSVTGLTFQTQEVTDDNFDTELTTVDQSLSDGVPVPIRLGSGDNGHFALVTGADPGPPRRYSIHDPWDGKTVVVTDQQLKTGDFNIANYNQVTHIFKPTAAAGGS